MIMAFTQYCLKVFLPWLKAFSTRCVYFTSRVRIGRNFRVDGVPRIIVDPQSQLIIGNDVEFRRNVEIRVHGASVVRIMDNVRIDRGVRILASNDSRVQIGKGVRIGLYTVLNGGAPITIGSGSLISGFVYLQASMHGYRDSGKRVQDQGYQHAAIVLGEDTWLGAHVVVMPGTTISRGVVVGSNAVVTKDFDAFRVVAGVPATEIGQRE